MTSQLLINATDAASVLTTRLGQFESAELSGPQPLNDPDQLAALYATLNASAKSIEDIQKELKKRLLALREAQQSDPAKAVTFGGSVVVQPRAKVAVDLDQAKLLLEAKGLLDAGCIMTMSVTDPDRLHAAVEKVEAKLQALGETTLANEFETELDAAVTTTLTPDEDKLAALNLTGSITDVELAQVTSLSYTYALTVKKAKAATSTPS